MKLCIVLQVLLCTLLTKMYILHGNSQRNARKKSCTACSPEKFTQYLISKNGHQRDFVKYK